MLSSSVSLSQTRKAINQRKKRAIDRQKKRHDVFVRDYISTKYKAIYAECNAAFNELLHAYPNKLDLTKTYRYLKWKRTIENGPSETDESVPTGIQDVQSSETDESVPTGIQDVENEIEIPNPEEATLDEMERAVNNIIREFEQDDQIMKYLTESV